MTKVKRNNQAFEMTDEQVQIEVEKIRTSVQKMKLNNILFEAGTAVLENKELLGEDNVREFAYMIVKLQQIVGGAK